MWIERIALVLSFSATVLLTSCAYYWPVSEESLAEVRIFSIRSAVLTNCKQKGSFYVHLGDPNRQDFGREEARADKLVRRITVYKGGNTAVVINDYSLSVSDAPGTEVGSEGYIYRCQQ